FFFQEEDGIRDRNVTGVQTCALPICRRRGLRQRGRRRARRGAPSDHDLVDWRRVAEPEEIWFPLVDEPIGSIVEQMQAEDPDIRSEERRGGKGGRAGDVRDAVEERKW